jgi:hypothetical protein
MAASTVSSSKNLKPRNSKPRASTLVTTEPAMAMHKAPTLNTQRALCRRPVPDCLSLGQMTKAKNSMAAGKIGLTSPRAKGPTLRGKFTAGGRPGARHVGGFEQLGAGVTRRQRWFWRGLSTPGSHPLPASPIQGEVSDRVWARSVQEHRRDTSPLMGEAGRG